MLLLHLLFGAVQHAAAAAPAIVPHGAPNAGLDATGAINTIFDGAIKILTSIAGAVAVIYLIYYGIQYITSGGSPDKTKAARAGIINAIIGIVVITAAYGIIRFAISLGTTVNTLNNGAAVTTGGGGGGTGGSGGTGGTGGTGGGTGGGVSAGGGCLVNTSGVVGFTCTDATILGTTDNKWCRFGTNCLTDDSYKAFVATGVPLHGNTYYHYSPSYFSSSTKWCRDDSNCLSDKAMGEVNQCVADFTGPSTAKYDQEGICLSTYSGD